MALCTMWGERQGVLRVLCYIVCCVLVFFFPKAPQISCFFLVPERKRGTFFFFLFFLYNLDFYFLISLFKGALMAVFLFKNALE
jgi:hypothetical protein